MSSQQSPSRSGESDGRHAIQSLVAGALRRALLAPPDSAEGEVELRRTIRALADAARGRGLRAEQLVVALREAWTTLPEARAITPRSRRAEVAAHLVGVCIDEYYAGAKAGTGED